MMVPADGTIALVGVHVWNGDTHEASQKSVIHITNGRIDSIAADSGIVRDATQFDYDGAFAIPGLIDAHVHLGLDPTKGVEAQWSIPDDERRLAMQRRAETMLRSGITTARDLGGGDFAELVLRDAIDRGELAGPRLLCAGQPVTTPGGHCHFWGGEAGNAAERAAVVDRQLERGVDWIKAMATGGVATKGTSPGDVQLDEQALGEIVARARAAGRAVAAHCHGTAGIANAARAGVRTIEHCSFAGPSGFGSAFDAAVVSELVANGSFVSPTVNAGWGRRIEKDGAPTAFFTRMAHVLRTLVAGGVPLVASTDAGIPGVHHHRLVEGLLALGRYAGLEGAALLRTATVEAARALGLAHETGRLAPGLAADVLVVADDPLTDPETLLRPIAVFGRGRRVDGLPFERR